MRSPLSRLLDLGHCSSLKGLPLTPGPSITIVFGTVYFVNRNA